MRKQFIPFFFALALLFGLLSFSGCKKEAPKQAPPQFKVLQLTKKTGELRPHFTTTIESSQIVEVRPRVEGYIDKVYVEDGQNVKKGDVLFLINQDDFKQRLLAAEADVLVSEANLDNAKLEVEKVSPLVKKGIVSEFQLKAAESALSAAEAKVTQAKASREQARINLSYTQITAQASGTISRVNVNEGALVRMSDASPMTVISADGDVLAYFSVNEKLLNIERNNKTSSLPQAELALSNGVIYSEKGKLELASGIVNTQTGTILLKAIFPNKDNRLRTGQSGNVVIPITIPDAILVPKSATYEILNKTMVVLVDESNTVHSKEITIIGSDAMNYIVTSGLNDGDRIVIEGVRKLVDGTVITPVATENK